MKNIKFLASVLTIATLVPLLSSCNNSGEESESDIEVPAFEQVYADDEQVDTSNALVFNADFSKTKDPALVKKIQMYNAGCIQPVENYARDMELAKAMNPESLRIDVSLGKDNGQGGLNLVTNDYEIYDYNEEDETYKVDKDSLNYDFSVLDNTLSYFEQMEVLPYLAWCYIPLPLAHNGEFRNLENNITNWQEVWEECYYNYVKYYLEKGVQIGYHEIYNEPDLEILKQWGGFDEDDNFFLDDQDFAPNGDPSKGCYPDMYEYGVKGVLRADPDATVGGPAFAMGELGVQDWVGFFPRVKEKRLQMDFYSFHSYLDGHTWYMPDYRRNRGDKNELESVVDGLQSDKLFLKTDVHINEYTPLCNGNGALSGDNAAYNYYAGASHALDAVFEVVDRVSVNMVSWAQLLSVNNAANDPYGIISDEGYEKSMYNAVRMYQDMPVWRYDIEENQEGVRSVVSADDDKISILLWNTNEAKDSEGNISTDGDKVVDVRVKNAKFDKGNRKIYRIDKNHASSFDETLTSGLSAQNLEYVTLNNNDSVWSGNIPANGVVYITIDKTELEDEFTYNEDFDYAPDSKFAQDVKVSYWHEDRYRDLKSNREEFVDFKNGVRGSYSHFDRKQWKMYLGMGDLEGNDGGNYIGQGVANGSVITKDLPSEFKVLIDMNSQLRNTSKYSSFGFRIDFYDDAECEYTNSVYFHNGIYTDNVNPNLQDPRLSDLTPYPWGTEDYADESVFIDSNIFRIDLDEYAPAGWQDGQRKAIISFDMRNCGANARASMQLVK